MVNIVIQDFWGGFFPHCDFYIYFKSGNEKNTLHKHGTSSFNINSLKFIILIFNFLALLFSYLTLLFVM